jgi:hypothetical protein
MSDTTNLISFSRDEFLASLRALLVGFVEWSEFILGTDLVNRPEQSPSRGGDFSRPNSAGVAIERSFVVDRMKQVYDFATTGAWDEDSLDDFSHELVVLEQLCRIDLESPGGIDLAPSIAPPRLPTPQQMCQRVLDHAKSRLSLLRSEPLELTELAMLAGLAEKTVRMAANPKAKDCLVTFKDGHRTYVAPDEALRWLSARPGFRPTQIRNRLQSARTYSSLDSLAWHCRKLRETAGLSLPQLFKLLAWTKAQQNAYRQLEEASADLDPRPLTVPQLIKLGQKLGTTDSKQFARSAATCLAPIAIDREFAATKA